MGLGRAGRTIVTLLMLGAFGAGLCWQPTLAQELSPRDVRDLVRTFGIGWVVDRLADQLDEAINAALARHQVEVEGATKVVPVISADKSEAVVGAAQVMGPQVQVDKVQAVAETRLEIPGAIRSRGLVPVSTRDVSDLRSVSGVTVSANIKFPI